MDSPNEEPALPITLNVDAHVRETAEVLVSKYKTDQARFPEKMGTSYVTHATEFGMFMDAVCEANPQFHEELGYTALNYGKDRRFANAVMDILRNAAHALRERGHGMPPIPDLFDKAEQGPGFPLRRFKPNTN